MNPKTKFYLLLIVIAQLFFFSGWYAYNYYILYRNPHTKSIVLKAIFSASTDPLSGEYIDIKYEFAHRDSLKQLRRVQYNPKSSIAYVVFQQQGSYYQAQYLTSKRPTQLEEQQIFIKGRVVPSNYSSFNTFNMNAEKYFIDVQRLRKYYKKVSRLKDAPPVKKSVRLIVTQTGRAIPQQILFDGQPL